jgi:hypothetical protein
MYHHPLSLTLKDSISMTIYTLYVKVHRKTGLRYLGQTKKNPNKYLGSGVDWSSHLEKFGDDIDTEILLKTTDWEELKYWGRYYSKLWRVVTSMDDFGNKIWANKIPETGGGGNHTEQRKELFRQQQLGRKKATRTDTHKQNLSKSLKGIPKPRSKKHQEAWNESAKQNWSTNIKRKEQISALGKASRGRKHSQETLDKKSQAMKEYWAVKRAQALQHDCKPVLIQGS